VIWVVGIELQIIEYRKQHPKSSYERIAKNLVCTKKDVARVLRKANENCAKISEDAPATKSTNLDPKLPGFYTVVKSRKIYVPLEMKVTITSLGKDILIDINYGEEIPGSGGFTQMEMSINDQIISIIDNIVKSQGEKHDFNYGLVHFPARFYIKKNNEDDQKKAK